MVGKCPVKREIDRSVAGAAVVCLSAVARTGAGSTSRAPGVGRRSHGQPQGKVSVRIKK